MSNPAPLDDDSRLHALDILRGLALFGMILVHFHQRMRLEVTGLEDLIGWGVWVLVEQKAWGVFAFLFGVGFAILLRRLEARGQPVVPIYLRRLAALAVFGMIAQVGFGFSILFEYACWGVVLLVVRRWPTRRCSCSPRLAACARPVAAELTALHAWWTHGPLPSRRPATARWPRPSPTAAQQPLLRRAVAPAGRSFVGEPAPHRGATSSPTSNLALFILGLLAVRHGVLDEPRRHTGSSAGG